MVSNTKSNPFETYQTCDLDIVLRPTDTTNSNTCEVKTPLLNHQLNTHMAYELGVKNNVNNKDDTDVTEHHLTSPLDSKEDSFHRDYVLVIRERIFANLLFIAGFSIVGVLIRIAIEELFIYDNSPMFGIAYAEFIGCIIMGIAISRKKLLLSVYYPLQIGISTGLCGSITTFSAWQLVATDAVVFSSGSTLFRNFGLAIGLIGLQWGKRVSSFVHFFSSTAHVTVSKTSWVDLFGVNIFDIILSIVFLAIYIALGFGAIAIDHVLVRQILFSVLMAPPGAICRWILGKMFNRQNWFPVGTFLANFVGSIIANVLMLILKCIDSTSLTATVYVGGITGFCGCLTTVSTFVSELTTLTPSKAVLYCLLSIACSQIIMLLMNAIFRCFESSTCDILSADIFF